MKLTVITGTCGAGKSTVRDILSQLLDGSRFACFDTDGLGLNWWDYAGTDHEQDYSSDCLKRAVQLAGGRDIVFASCLNPLDYFRSTDLPPEIEATVFAALCPSDEAIWERLRARPAERGFTSDEKILPHAEYNKWFRKNRGKFALFIDNTDQPPDQTAELLAEFILSHT